MKGDFIVRTKRIIAIVVSCIVGFSAVSITSLALGTQRTIDIEEGVDVYMNGEKLQMTDVSGNPVEAFIYNGTTYLPARAISEANGKNLEWDGDKGEVYITDGEIKEGNEVSNVNDPTAANVAAEADKYYIFELSDNVNRTHVTYRNRYGIELSADLYTPKDLDSSKDYPAVVIGPPYGGVKEQGPGVYANQLAQRGFVALTFDPSYNGESGGEPRHLSSPEIFSEDFCAGVDYLGCLDYVDREKIGAIGICGSGGFALSAAAMDTRIKAVVTSAMYDISGMGTMMDNDARRQFLDGISQQRWTDFETGEPAYTRTYPEDAPLDELPDTITGLDEEWWTFYGMKRGWHPNSGGSFTNTSMLSFSNYALLQHIDSISPRPILFITGDIAHSRSMSEGFYAQAAEPKELYVVEGAMHIDLYDDVTKIPFDKIESFLTEAFN